MLDGNDYFTITLFFCLYMEPPVPLLADLYGAVLVPKLGFPGGSFSMTRTVSTQRAVPTKRTISTQRVVPMKRTIYMQRVVSTKRTVVSTTRTQRKISTQRMASTQRMFSTNGAVSLQREVSSHRMGSSQQADSVQRAEALVHRVVCTPLSAYA